MLNGSSLVYFNQRVIKPSSLYCVLPTAEICDLEQAATPAGAGGAMLVA